ncbi:beta-propeller fold lactonase family protein, partial [Bacillus sp. D-CC]
GIILSPNGKYVIAANRGADNKLLVFKIQQNGLLGQPQVYKDNGIEPRAFSFGLRIIPLALLNSGVLSS